MEVVGGKLDDTSRTHTHVEEAPAILRQAAFAASSPCLRHRLIAKENIVEDTLS